MPAAVAAGAGEAAAELERLRQAIQAQEARLRQQTGSSATTAAQAAAASAVQARKRAAQRARLEAGFPAALAAAQREAAEAAAAGPATAGASEAEVRRVLESRDDYAVLQLAPGAAAATIRKRYRCGSVACRLPLLLARMSDLAAWLGAGESGHHNKACTDGFRRPPSVLAATTLQPPMLDFIAVAWCRELAVSLHPDKCSAPGAKDAFQRLVRAYQNLSKYAQ
jgi:hypothetical protein